jgi:cellulose synthase/poly-beta-1,6-N-acetylglucosamine synthase-like glycosyltransferase
MELFIVLILLNCLKVICYLIMSGKRLPVQDVRGEKKANGLGPVRVDIIMPMYNEEKVILKTIENLLNIDYQQLSIIVINDGSTDGGGAILQENYGNHPRIRVIHQENAGKSAALNRGLDAASGEIVICIDADTMVRSDVVHKMLPHFLDEKVSAVSGYVKVGNRVNLLTDIQYFEYISVVNYDRIVFESFNGIIVVPGALGAFRRSIMNQVGGFECDAMAEDCDLTLRMLCNGYVIRNAPEAMAFTEAPATIKSFINQRVRWTVGLLQGLFKHGKGLLGHPNKALSCVVLPFTWIYRIILPFLIPIADFYFLYIYFIRKENGVLPVFGLYILIESVISLFLILKRKERISVFKLIVLRRCLHYLTLLTYLFVFIRWMNGNLFSWRKAPRKGSVNLN